MKKILIFMCFISLAATCQENTSSDQDDPCSPDVMCTMDFRIINLEIVDQNGEAVIFEDFYTEFDDFKVSIQKEEFQIEDGFYPVVTDGHMDQLNFEGKRAFFKGFRNGKEILNHELVIGKDCCHVMLISGDEKIVLNQ